MQRDLDMIKDSNLEDSHSEDRSPGLRIRGDSDDFTKAPNTGI